MDNYYTSMVVRIRTKAALFKWQFNYLCCLCLDHFVQALKAGGLVDQIIAAPVSIGSSGSLGGMGTAKPSRPTLG
eukprot:scaffold62631_cov18-Tisochrysis_lutea.AAC.1